MKQHKISLITAILLNINIMVGSGILVGPGIMAKIAGNASFLTWALVALLLLPVVLSIVELSKLFPGAGGFYLYTKKGLGPTAGFLSGWLYVIGYTFSVALEIALLRESLVALSQTLPLISQPFLFDLLTITGCTLFNLLNFKIISRSLSASTLCEISPLIILIFLTPFIINPHFTVTTSELMLLPWCMPMALFGYFGFECSANISETIIDKKKNAPRAIVIGFIATAVLYTLFHFGLLNAMNAQNLARYNAPDFAAFINIPYLKQFLRFLIPTVSIIAIYGTAVALMNTNAFLLYAMANEKILKPHALTRLNRNERPWLIILAQGCLTLLMTSTITNSTALNSLCNLSVFLSFFLVILSLLKIQQTKRSYTKLFLSALSLIIIIGLIVYSWYSLATLITIRLVYTLILFFIILVGLLLHRP